MNKITTTLAGLALLAGASMVPASAQTAYFTTTGPFTFTATPTTVDISNIAGFYDSTTPVLLSLTGTLTSGTTYTGAFSYTYLGATQTSSPVSFVEAPYTPGTFSFTGTVAPTLTSEAEFFSLAGGSTSAPVPEASTVVSFGALLALGGLAVLRRKSIVKNAA